MRVGIALQEGVDHQPQLLTAVRNHRFTPRLVALWCRGLVLDTEALTRLVDYGYVPVLYATSHGMEYADILAGKHDERIDAFARSLPDRLIRIRWDQEPNGEAFGAPWTFVSPLRYRAVFRHVSARIRAIRPRVRMIYCVIWRGRQHAADLRQWWPGDEAAQIVAVDLYDRHGTVPLSTMARAAHRAFREFTRRPFWITELGVEVGVPKRARQLRTLRGIRGVSAIVYFDFRLDFHGRIHDWRLNRWMVKALEDLADD